MDRTVARKPAGFTLIEIVLVLAIAALLLIMVFLALTGAQKSRRDSQRRQDAALMAGFILQYSSNREGVHPEDQHELDEVVAGYFAEHKDPLTGAAYDVKYSHAAEATHDKLPNEGQILYGREHFCDQNNGTILDDTGAHFYADHFIIIYQEQGKYYCLDNRDN